MYVSIYVNVRVYRQGCQEGFAKDIQDIPGKVVILLFLLTSRPSPGLLNHLTKGAKLMDYDYLPLQLRS